jgi:hypothetical protein
MGIFSGVVVPIGISAYRNVSNQEREEIKMPNDDSFSAYQIWFGAAVALLLAIIVAAIASYLNYRKPKK